MKVDEIFSRLAKKTAHHAGHSTTFILAVAVVLLWVITGPLFQWSDSWQLVINTGTTIITFLMVFLIQHTQNNDSEALHLKMDELIRVSKARNIFLEMEDLSEEEMNTIKDDFLKLAAKAKKKQHKH
jgi:low affinity Fe/Cu permease